MQFPTPTAEYARRMDARILRPTETGLWPRTSRTHDLPPANGTRTDFASARESPQADSSDLHQTRPSNAYFLDTVYGKPEYDASHKAGLKPPGREEYVSMTDVSDKQQHRAPELGDSAEALVDLVVRGMYRGELSSAQHELVAAGFALAKGPLIMPTPAGSAAAGQLVRLDADSQEERRIRALFEVFLPINRQLRDLCTAWQTRPDGTPNDHTDPAYEAQVRDELDDIHTAVARVLRRLTQCDTRFEHYTPELAEALDKLDAGDGSWLASPLKPSYHTVWMRLHQELLLLLGITRAEDEALEHQLVAGLRS